MQLVVKIILSLAVILLAVAVGRKIPSMGGLIAVMPLTGLIVMLWLYSETSGDTTAMQQYARGALFGIIPTMLFFAVAFIGFLKEWGLPLVLFISFAAWIVAALFHQWWLK